MDHIRYVFRKLRENETNVEDTMVALRQVAATQASDAAKQASVSAKQVSVAAKQAVDDHTVRLPIPSTGAMKKMRRNIIPAIVGGGVMIVGATGLVLYGMDSLPDKWMLPSADAKKNWKNTN